VYAFKWCLENDSYVSARVYAELSGLVVKYQSDFPWRAVFVSCTSNEKGRTL